MARDLFEEYGIKAKRKPIDVFEQEGISFTPESKGFKGIASDAFNKAIETAMNIPSSLMALPGEVSGIQQQAYHDPQRVLKNIGGGLGELGHGILSAPGNIRDYLARKDILSEKAPSFRLPESILPKDYNYAEALGVKGEQPGDALLQALPSAAAAAPFAEAITARIPGITNSAIANRLSADKSAAIKQAGEGYNQFFNKARNYGVEEIERPNIMAGDIVKNSQPKHHKALLKFLDNPTLENAHWAQSDLGFLKRHLEGVDKKQGLTSTQHDTLKNVIQAQNRIKERMFNEKQMVKNPEFEQEYNKLSGDYAQNVIPYKQLDELSDYEGKRLKANNMIKSLLNNDEFMLGLGRKYPQIQLNRALRSKPAKWLGKGVALGLGFEGLSKLLK